MIMAHPNPDANSVPEGAALWWINAAAWLCLTGAVIGFVLGPVVARGGIDRDHLEDYILNCDTSARVLESNAYPIGFTYPVPAVLMRVGIGAFGPVVGPMVWMTLIVIATIACFELLITILDLRGHPLRHVVVLCAAGSIKYFLEWDIKSLNCNAMYFALVLGGIVCLLRDRYGWAGGLIAASVAMKLYSILFLPYLVFRGRYRVAAHATVALVIFFAIGPALVLGPSRAANLSLSWWKSMRAASHPAFIFKTQAELVSLHRTVFNLTTHRGGEGICNLVEWGEGTVHGFVAALQAIWFAAVLAYFAMVRHAYCASPLGIAVDSAVLVLAVLPLSPQLQPHHGVVLLLPAMLLARRVICPDHVDRTVATAQRASMCHLSPWPTAAVSAALLAAMYVVLELGPAGLLRGLGVQLTILIAFGATFVVGRSNSQPATRIRCRTNIAPDCLADAA